MMDNELIMMSNENMTNSVEEIEITLPQQESISDLIGNPPGWILQSGITTIAIVVIAILTAGFFIEYPDKINCIGSLQQKILP